MKKIIVFFAAAMMLALILISCKKTTLIPIQYESVKALMPTFTPTPIDTPPPFVPNLAPLLDDMNDNDNRNNWGGYWYTFDDLASPGPGTSYVVPWTDARWAASGGSGTFFMQAPGNGGTGFAARMTGFVTTGFTYGFVGMGTSFSDPKAGMNLALCTEISFYQKGDGKQYRMKISSAAPEFLLGNGDDHYGYAFTSTTDWTLVVVPVASMTREGWGTAGISVATAMGAASDIQWQTIGQGAGVQAGIDLWVDDVTFTGCGF